MELFVGVLNSIADPTQLAISTSLIAASLTSYFLYLIGKDKRSIVAELAVAGIGSVSWALGLMSTLIAFGVHF